MRSLMTTKVDCRLGSVLILEYTCRLGSGEGSPKHCYMKVMRVVKIREDENPRSKRSIRLRRMKGKHQ